MLDSSADCLGVLLTAVVGGEAFICDVHLREPVIGLASWPPASPLLGNPGIVVFGDERLELRRKWVDVVLDCRNECRVHTCRSTIIRGALPISHGGAAVLAVLPRLVAPAVTDFLLVVGVIDAGEPVVDGHGSSILQGG